MYLFERILQRLSVSKYRDNFILKGGLLISSIIGISERTTMDMDTTVKGIAIDEDTIRHIIENIISIDVSDGIQFEVKKIEPIHGNDEYNNFRVYINAIYGKMNNSMKIDITTGDKITPSEIQYFYPMMLEDNDIEIMGYPLENILAEKYETIIRRNIGNTRARDFYDLYVLFRTKKDNIKKEILRQAITNTATKRNSLDELKDYKAICEELREEDAVKHIWINYIKDNEYAASIKYEDIVQNILDIGDYIMLSS